MTITMLARAVVAAGEPFVAHPEGFSDPGVALDWITELRPTSEPVALRVSASGGSRRERESLQGDWLCDADGSAPRMVAPAEWDFDDAAGRWASGMAWIDAWEVCKESAWLLMAACWVGSRRRGLVAALCDLADSYADLRATPRARRACREAVSSARRWAAGAAPLPGESALRDAADDVLRADADVEPWSPSRAAIQAAYVAVVATFSERQRLYRLARSAVVPLSDGGRLRLSADRVRAAIPTIDVLRAAAGG